MQFIRIDNDHLQIIPKTDDERIELENALFWNTEKSELISVICKLEGYQLEDKPQKSG